MNREQEYLRDVLVTLIERAKEARAEAKAARDGPPDARTLAEGRALAYYEVVAYMVGQASVFELDGLELPAVNFDADRELLN